MKEPLQQARSTQVPLRLDDGAAEDEQCTVLASPLEQKVQSDDPSRHCSRLPVVQTAGIMPRLFAKLIDWAIKMCCWGLGKVALSKCGLDIPYAGLLVSYGMLSLTQHVLQRIISSIEIGIHGVSFYKTRGANTRQEVNGLKSCSQGN